MILELSYEEVTALNSAAERMPAAGRGMAAVDDLIEGSAEDAGDASD